MEKIAPVQGYSAGIPWSMHLRAYDAYCKKYGSQQALIEGNCRGGFGVSELDVFIPGWREELNENNQLKATIKELREALQEARQFIAVVECEDGLTTANLCDKIDAVLESGRALDGTRI